MKDNGAEDSIHLNLKPKHEKITTATIIIYPIYFFQPKSNL